MKKGLVALIALAAMMVAIALVIFNARTNDRAREVSTDTSTGHSGKSLEASGDMSDAEVTARASVGQVSSNLVEMSGAGLPFSEQVPYAQQLPALQEAARGGDPRAACQLSIIRAQCSSYEFRRSWSEFAFQKLAEKNPQESGRGLLVLMLAAQDDQSEDRIATLCEGVDASVIDDLSKLASRSLPSMSIRQKVVFALIQSDGTIRSLRRPPFFAPTQDFVASALQTEYAEQFLLEGLAARDLMALEGLVLLYAPGSILRPLGVSIWKPNPVEFARYALLLTELMGPDYLGERGLRLLASTRVVLDDEVYSELEAAARAQARSWSAVNIQGSVSDHAEQFEQCR